MWEKISKQHRSPPHSTILLLGSAAASGFEQFGPVSRPSQVVTYHRSQQTFKDGIIKNTLDVFRIQSLDKSIVDQIPITGPCLLIHTLSWTQTEKWASIIEQIERISKSKQMRVVLTTTDNDKITKHSHAATALSKSIDFCHQYLRTMAMRLEASLIYSMDPAVTLEWVAIASHILDIQIFDDNSSPKSAQPEQLYGSVVCIYGDDSREKILAVNPDFDFDRAINFEIEIPAITGSASQETKTVSYKSLPDEMAETLASFDTKINQSSRPPNQVSRALLEGSDDKKVMSEFFTTMVQRST